MAFFSAMAALPLIPLVDAGEQSLQPVHIDDLVRAICQLLACRKVRRTSIEIVGARCLTLKEMLTALRRWLGLGQARFVSIPYRLVMLAAQLVDGRGNVPLTTEAIEMLRKGNTGEVARFVDCFGFKPMDFETGLRRKPVGQAEQWQAGLYFLRPMLRYTIALVWILTGIVSAFIYPREHSFDLLAQAGIPQAFAGYVLYSAAFMDMALGVATWIGYRLSIMGWIQIAVILGYTLIISVALPEQWIHPFGPISKNLPLIVAILIMMVLERK